MILDAPWYTTKFACLLALPYPTRPPPFITLQKNVQQRLPVCPSPYRSLSATEYLCQAGQYEITSVSTHSVLQTFLSNIQASAAQHTASQKFAYDMHTRTLGNPPHHPAQAIDSSHKKSNP